MVVLVSSVVLVLVLVFVFVFVVFVLVPSVVVCRVVVVRSYPDTLARFRHEHDRYTTSHDPRTARRQTTRQTARRRPRARRRLVRGVYDVTRPTTRARTARGARRPTSTARARHDDHATTRKPSCQDSPYDRTYVRLPQSASRTYVRSDSKTTTLETRDGGRNQPTDP